ncbi:PP2C family protein-serine/threonine phosphatase [Streptomyces brasiliensis]|uniref:PP2C family protein-serine/threonine phosphatase n=1 Tax=Streptomyces brasiliensis TaxID=1954 RepID=UPI001671431C|nr:PP2C family protein-serine/threonine phosphatase [Streptomyces brasiliensis]
MTSIDPEPVPVMISQSPLKAWLRRHASPLVASATLVTITLAGLLIPEDIHFGSLFVAVPALTAVAPHARVTLCMTGLACVGSVAVDIRDGLARSSILPIHVLDVLVICGLVLVLRRIRDMDHQTLAAIRAVSETAQRALLRPLPCRVGCLRIAAAYRSADAHARIGGDIYAAERVDGTVRFLIGDVRGKGLAAVDDAAAVLGSFRESAHRDATLDKLARSLETSVQRHLAQYADCEGDASERFITALVVEVPDDTTEVRVISCGHPNPMMSRRTGTCLLDLAQPAPPLGLGGPDPGYRVDTFRYDPGDTLLLYTDGLIEARDASGTFYPALDRFATLDTDEPHSVITGLLTDLTAHAGGEVRDDVALVAVQRRCTSAPSPSHPPPVASAHPPTREMTSRRCGDRAQQTESLQGDAVSNAAEANARLRLFALLKAQGVPADEADDLVAALAAEQ